MPLPTKSARSFLWPELFKGEYLREKCWSEPIQTLLKIFCESTLDTNIIFVILSVHIILAQRISGHEWVIELCIIGLDTVKRYRYCYKKYHIILFHPLNILLRILITVWLPFIRDCTINSTVKIMDHSIGSDTLSYHSVSIPYVIWNFVTEWLIERDDFLLNCVYIMVLFLCEGGATKWLIEREQGRPGFRLLPYRQSEGSYGKTQDRTRECERRSTDNQEQRKQPQGMN